MRPQPVEPAALKASLRAPHAPPSAGTPAEDTEIEPDEYLWEKLPGRCCFAGFLVTRTTRTASGSARRRATSATCGASLTTSATRRARRARRAGCASTARPRRRSSEATRRGAPTCAPTRMARRPGRPTAARRAPRQVCIDDSRVGEGCNDELGTGVCAAQGLGECQSAAPTRTARSSSTTRRSVRARTLPPRPRAHQCAPRPPLAPAGRHLPRRPPLPLAHRGAAHCGTAATERGKSGGAARDPGDSTARLHLSAG